MADRGEVSLADLLRASHPGEVFTVGFLTHSGRLMAAPAWDRPGQVYRLPPASRGSVEGFLHRAGLGRSVLMLRNGDVRGALSEWRPQRGIGVVFDPGASPELSYSRARLGTHFDAVAFLDQTEALAPLP
jgi:erythromycin esterase-like protein